MTLFSDEQDPRGEDEPNPQYAFLNVPFDKQFEPLYLAFIAGVSGFGLTPQAVIQIPGRRRCLESVRPREYRCCKSFVLIKASS